jgi:hypothetical protein
MMSPKRFETAFDRLASASHGLANRIMRRAKPLERLAG